VKKKKTPSFGGTIIIKVAFTIALYERYNVRYLKYKEINN